VESSDLAVRKINEYGSLVRENVLQNNIWNNYPPV
jgi:hypothetical protein